jgi:mRNA-degrading endonuclease RelE of RelBE toxin-antitoxin system
MVVVSYSDGFEQAVKKLDPSLKEKLKKQVIKIITNPLTGKPMRYERKGTREVYVKPYRLAYAYIDEKIIFLDFYHKKEQ